MSRLPSSFLLSDFHCVSLTSVFFISRETRGRVLISVSLRSWLGRHLVCALASVGARLVLWLGLGLLRVPCSGLVSHQESTHVLGPCSRPAHAAQCCETCMRPEAQQRGGVGVPAGPRGMGRMPGLGWEGVGDAEPQGVQMSRGPWRPAQPRVGASGCKGVAGLTLQDSWELCPVGKELGRSRVCGLTFQRGSASTRGTGKGGAALRPEGAGAEIDGETCVGSKILSR